MNFPIMKNRKIHRRKVDSNNLNNKNKKIDVSPNSNYLINDDFYLVDVPGYGYAAVDKKTQNKSEFLLV